MSRIAKRFQKLKSENKKALIPYVTAGDCNPQVTVPLMHSMVEAGADIIELGVPFSDPMADGPVIQLACERALEHKVSLSDVLNMVAEFRAKDSETPVVLMGYLNPVEVMGYKNFAERAKTAGLDGVLTVDMPPEESTELLNELKANDLDAIFLVSPESTVERFQSIAQSGSGFIYYVSLKGVTGVKTIDTDAVAAKLSELRKHTDVPIGVGFGINDAATAASVAKISDAVVVGSSVVKRIDANQNNPEKINGEIHAFLSELRQAMDAV